MQKDYRTIKQRARAKLIEKKSNFIADARPVTTEEEALSFLAEIKKEFPDATHHVYAYVLRENNIARFSDDGEPGGTAGMPMMEVLKQEELTDLIVVVTRYFGGTLLGAGGLVRAYSKSAKMGIDAAGIGVMTSCVQVSVTVSYELYGKVRHLLEQEDVEISDTEFGQDVTVFLYVRARDVAALEEKLTDVTGGNLTFSEEAKLHKLW